MINSENTVSVVPPTLMYCKENVIEIFNQFEIARNSCSKSDSSWTLEALMQKDALLRTRQNCLTKMRQDKNRDYKNWRVVKEDLFRVLIKILHEKGVLKLYDERLHLKAISGHFYHALNSFFNNDDRQYPIKSLAGLYRCYQPSTEYDNLSLIGNCEIKYESLSNSLSVFMEQDYTPEGLSTRRHRFKGTIIRNGAKNFIWVDQDEHGNMQRLIKGILAQNSPEGGEEKIISLNGWCQYTFENRELVRRIFLERNDTPIRSDYYPYTETPKYFQPYIIRNSKKHINVLEF